MKNELKFKRRSCLTRENQHFHEHLKNQRVRHFGKPVYKLNVQNYNGSIIAPKK